MAGAALSESCDGMKPEGLPIFLSLLLSTIQRPGIQVHFSPCGHNLNGGKIRSSLRLRWARHCRLRDDTARCARSAECCGRPQGRRFEESEDSNKDKKIGKPSGFIPSQDS